MVLSLIAGSSITLVLAMMRADGFLADIADTLLRPGAYVADKLGVTGPGGILLTVLADGIFYGSLPFLIMRMRAAKHRKPRAQLHKFEPLIERRRAARVTVKAPVFVYGWTSNEPFSEMTESLNISSLGGLLPLAAKVVPAQKLILINADSNAELPCRVARAIRTAGGETMIGVEFSQSSAQFWQAPEPAADLTRLPIHSAV
jgi:hypothetical protein